MVDSSGRYVITYNGEIYNYVELRQELKALGVEFRLDSDTEVVLEAYKQWGEACLGRFNGMFSFALYDSVEERLFCARDKLSERLVYAGVHTMIHYPIPPHLQQAYAELGYREGDFPVAEAIHCEALSFPIGPQLSADQWRKCCGVLRVSDGCKWSELSRHQSNRRG